MYLKMLRSQADKEVSLKSLVSAAQQALGVYAAYTRSGFISLNERKVLKRLEEEMHKHCVKLQQLFGQGLTVQNEGKYHDEE